MTKNNIVNLEGDYVSVEIDALSEERENAKQNYHSLELEYKALKALDPFPEIGQFTVGWDIDDAEDLKFKKAYKADIIEKEKALYDYRSSDKLYDGHLQLDSGEDFFFMDSSHLKTKELSVNGKTVMLINTDDENYKKLEKRWHFPSNYSDINLSRNVLMEKKTVKSVDIVLDKSSSLFSKITDNYLRNALIRNKDKDSIGSIIQTIQQKQDDIRGLEKRRSFIVQGCAGSGKTMVLLHRLRYLLYNRAFGGKDYCFLVPSLSFRKYIRDIALKFNINPNYIFSYQSYYSFMLNKFNPNSSVEQNELVFPADYLERVYSESFIRECYMRVLKNFSEQFSNLSDYCDHMLTELLEKETAAVEAAIVKLRTDTIYAVADYVSKFAELKDYSEIPVLLESASALLADEKEQMQKMKFQVENIQIAPDDARIVSDEKLRLLDNDIEAVKLQISKASVFTAASHKKKLEQLILKRDEYYKELYEQVLEQERLLRQAELSDHSILFEGCTITEVESLLAQAKSIYSYAESHILREEEKLRNMKDYFASKYSAEISALVDMIEGSADLPDIVSSLSLNLNPAHSLTRYISLGCTVFSAFSHHVADAKEAESFRSKFSFFINRTERELKAYLQTLIFNACKKSIKDEFSVKICDVYKHYWYLGLYCRYLCGGEFEHRRPFIFIDEAQDLSPSELRLINRINTPIEEGAAPVFNFFGDVNQTITGHGVKNWSELGFIDEVFTLDENFRNTNQIIDYCNSKLPFRMEKIGVDMGPVEEYADLESLLSSRVLPESAAFIVKDEFAADDLNHALRSAGVSDYQVFAVKSVKGMEFRRVYVIDRDMSPNEKYIAYTRSLANLTVIHSLPEISDKSKSLVIQGEDE